jgi:uncharacterized repeat protein (TIGR01451 family)
MKKKTIFIAAIAIIVLAVVGVSLKVFSPASTEENTSGTSESANLAEEPTGQIAGVTLPEEQETSSQDTTTTSQEPVSPPLTTSDEPQTGTNTDTNTRPASMTILSINGDVFVKRARTNDWIPATIGMTLEPEDAIRTGSNSEASVTFFEGSTIDLSGATELGVTSLGIADAGSTSIGLKQQIGKTVSRVQKLTDQESKYEIETPAAVAAVRGSVMVIIVEADGKTTVANEGGDIRVYAQGIEVIIPEGMQVTTIPGQSPGQPVPIGTPSGNGGGSGGGGGVFIATIDTQLQANVSAAYTGDIITYTYTISNTGNLVVLSVTIADTLTGTPSYSSGDTNSDTKLDPGETWIYTGAHAVSATDASPLTNSATFTAKVSETNSLTAVETAQVLILPSVQALNIETEILAVAEVGAEYSEVLSASGGSLPYTWSLAQGTLPDGLNIDTAAGRIYGTPTTAYISGFTIKVKDAAGSEVTRSFSISINGALTIDTDSLANGTVGADYSQALASANGTPPCVWSIIRGNLPPGLQFGTTGSITGKPTTAGTFVFTVRVTDKLGVTVTKEFTIIISN